MRVPLGRHCCIGVVVWLLFLSSSAFARHGYAIWGDLKYPENFTHFDYVNPKAPKGGELVLVSNLRVSTFDKYNPYSHKGSAPVYMNEVVFEGLLTGALDERGSGYGLLADDVTVASDKTWVRFHINPKARFNNGDPVLAKDVIHAFNMLTGSDASPSYKTIYAAVSGARQGDDERTVYFDLKSFDKLLPLYLGSLPIFSHKWGAGKAFGEITFDIPIASGPYTIGKVVAGRDVTYVRNRNYWGRDLNVRLGQNNFDAITVRIYKDETVKLEAFKAGEFDFMQEFSAGNWARQYRGKRFDSGDIVKEIFSHQMPTALQSYILNSRHEKYSDPRVRQALNLAYDYEWMNQTFFYGTYSRVFSYFGNTDYEANGLPSEAELALLAPLQAEFGKIVVPDAVLYNIAPIQPVTTAPHSLRENLKKARALLAEAGWHYKDGALRNSKGTPFVMTHLDSRESSISAHVAWKRALEKLGIRFESRVVDFSLWQRLLDNYEFDVVTIALKGSDNPGALLQELFSTQAADTPRSANWWGIKSPAIDHLIALHIAADNKAIAVATGQALDRMLRHGAYSVLQFSSNQYRIAYDTTKLVSPAITPRYYEVEKWVIGHWWSKNMDLSSSAQPIQHKGD